MMSDQTDHGVAVTAPYRHEITISVGGDSEDRIHIKTPPSVSTPTPSPRSIQSTTDEISTNSTDDDHAVLAPKQKTSPDGVDNLAFENEHKTSQQRPMSSFGPNGNGTMKEPTSNGKNDAVNLELVNLNKTPTTNGHRDNGFPQKKKDTTQVEMGNSYNEYFVPVNEHKKYMRGEKLYVTKDKRFKTNWRKRLLWVIGLALCAAVLIVAILLATGTIGSEPEPIESRQFSSKDKLATAGVFGSGSKSKGNGTYPATPQPPGSTVPPHPPTTDENLLYVPNSINGKFKIDNHEFLEKYKDHNSPIYQTIAREIEAGLMESLHDYKNVHVKVVDLTSGSIVVDYRVTWDEDEDLSDEVLSNSLSKYLKENYGYISSYFVPTETLSYTKVIDTCAMKTNEMRCDNGCEFNRELADFVCTKSESSAEPEPEVSSAEPEPEVSSSAEPEPEVSSSAEPEPDVASEPEPEGASEPESEPKSEVEPEPATVEPSAKQIEIVHDHAHHHHHHDHDHEHVTSEPISNSEPTSESEPNAESEPSAESEPTAEKEPSPEGEPKAEVEPEPVTLEPSAKQIKITHDHHEHEHVTSEPISKSEPTSESEPNSESEPTSKSEPIAEGEPKAESEPSPEGEPVTAEPTPNKEPSPEGEPSKVEPSAKQTDIESVTSEPVSKSEPSPAGEPTTEPSSEPSSSAEPASEPSSSAEPASQPSSSAEPSAEIVADDTTAEPAPEAGADNSGKKSNKNGKELSYDEEHLESSTQRKQQYTYDFESHENVGEKEEKQHDQHEHSSNTEQTVVKKAEDSKLRSTSANSEQPAPVTEDLSDDTPMPTTSNYLKPKSIEQQTEVNVMDGTVTPSSVSQRSSQTIYSTTAPIKLEHDDNSHPSIRPSASSEGPSYSVTENILEQSPFLPENENGDSVLNILHNSHDDEESKGKSLNLDNDDSLENEDANAISGPEIIPQKTYKVGAGSIGIEQSETTMLKGVSIESKTEDIPSDNTEIYHLQESRSHNHDSTEATKSIEKQSGETLEFSHGAVPTTIIPFENDDSTEMEHMTGLSDLMSIMEEQQSTEGKGVEIASSSSISPSSTTEESSGLKMEQTTYQARNIMKDINAISSESSDESSTEQMVSSTSEKVESSSETMKEINPSAEPSVSAKEETTILPSDSANSNSESESTTIRVEQTVSAVSVTNHTETKNEIITKAADDEVSPTAEPSLSSSNTEEKTPPLKDMEAKSESIVSSEKMSTTESVSETSAAAEPSSTESETNTKISETDLKEIPLQTTKRPDETIENGTEKKSSEKEITESTTGHFLSQATFQPSTELSVGTSLKSSDNEGNDSTGNGNEKKNVPNQDEMKLNDDDSSSTTTPMTTTTTMTITTTTTKITPNYTYTRCTAGQYECLNGTSMLGCPGHFQCGDGSCLARSLVCDKILHCADGSDEAENLCNDWKCKFDEMACSENGPCLPAILQCDGISHCSNQADETNCPDTCKNNEFFCSWQRKCIPETFVCDGKIDCSGGEDERLCDCPEDHFKCNTGRCVPGHYLCDGLPHCFDLSDDWDCFNLTTIQTIKNDTTKIDDIDSTPTTAATASALQIKTPNGKFAFVCYDNWNLNYSDLICKNFGFARSMDYSAIQVDLTDASLVKINDDYQHDESILTNFNETDSCMDSKIVALECEKYACGNNLTRDKNVDNIKTWPMLAVAVNELSSVHLSPRWALASYSCILGKFELMTEVEKTLNWNLQVRSSDGQNHNDSESQQVNVVRIFKYPQTKFKHFLYSGDVVLLELDTPLEFSETVTATCLNDEPIDSHTDNCVSVGWYSEEGETTRKTYVKKLNIPPLTTENCNATSNYAGSLPDDLVCIEDASDDNNTKCQINTDEGAPLLCYSNEKSSWQMIGILSYRSGCHRHALPAVYSELTASILKWITKTIGNNVMIERRNG